MNSSLPSVPLWPWPLRTLPRLTNAGRFPLADRDFRHRYCSPTVAIHLYDYHARFRLDGVEFPLAPGDLTISPAAGETRYHLDAPGHHWCIHLLPTAIRGPRIELPVVMRLGPHEAYARERFARIAALFDRARSDDHPALVAAGAALQELLCWLAASALEPLMVAAARSDQAVEHAARLLREDLLREWTVPALAAAVGLSRNYLAARFQRRFSMTIARYRLVQRIQQARILLGGSDVPVGEVARRVGIADPHHFNKLFRKQVGIAPSVCRSPRVGT